MAVTVDCSTCIACGVCVDACPFEIISLTDDAATITGADLYIECGACVSACPVAAISL